MMSEDEKMLIMLAVSAMRGKLPKEGAVDERLEFAMRYVRQNERNLFWMSTTVSDDLMLRTAIAAVLESALYEEHDLIMRSLRPLQMLSAAQAGVPVDWKQLDISPDLVPVLKIWHRAKEAT